VHALRYDGAEHARPAAKLIETLADPALRAIVICPSNPYLSIDPFFAMPMLRRALARSQKPVIAVSPIIGGKAVKGPTSKIMAELGIPVTTQSIAAHYRGIIDGIVVDLDDAHEAKGIDIPVLATRILMKNLTDSKRLAREVMVFAKEIAARDKVAAHDEAVASSHNAEKRLP
jgi:LPPG:FO 2-phospho-L-lactate transferase